MAKILNLLVDTDIFIDTLNHGLFKEIFEEYKIYYSVVTKKELLSKEGLSSTEEKAIRNFLHRFRLIPLDKTILQKYSELREQHPASAKPDTLIAAIAIVKAFPLLTRNTRHFQIFKELRLYLNTD